MTKISLYGQNKVDSANTTAACHKGGGEKYWNDLLKTAAGSDNMLTDNEFALLKSVMGGSAADGLTAQEHQAIKKEFLKEDPMWQLFQKTFPEQTIDDFNWLRDTVNNDGINPHGQQVYFCNANTNTPIAGTYSNEELLRRLCAGEISMKLKSDLSADDQSERLSSPQQPQLNKDGNTPATPSQ